MNQKTDVLPKGKEDKTKDSHKTGEWSCHPPFEWLEKEKWTALTALLLLTGLKPGRCRIKWDIFGEASIEHIECLDGDHYSDSYQHFSKKELEDEIRCIEKEAEISLETATNELNTLFDDAITAIEVDEEDPCSHEVKRNLTILANSKPVQYSKADFIEEDRRKICQKWLEIYQQREVVFNRLLEIWLATEGMPSVGFEVALQNRQEPVSFFLQWANDNNLTGLIPWWSYHASEIHENIAEPSTPIASDTNPCQKNEDFIYAATWGRAEKKLGMSRNTILKYAKKAGVALKPNHKGRIQLTESEAFGIKSAYNEHHPKK